MFDPSTLQLIKKIDLGNGPDARLAPAAVAALHHWFYRPTFVNGTPVEVITEVWL